MRRLLRSRRFWSFIAYIVLIALIIVSGALYGHHTHTKHLKAPSVSLITLHNTVDQVYLTATELRDTDGSLDTAPTTLAALQNSLQKSLETAKDLQKQHQKSLSKTENQKLTEALYAQEKLLGDYTDRYKLLGKAISYNPSLDLEILDNAQIIQRAQAAQTNLQALANNQNAPLSDRSTQALTAIANCFGLVADAAKSNNASSLKETRTRCIKNYTEVRAAVVKDLQAPYSTDEANPQFDKLLDVLQGLQPKAD